MDEVEAIDQENDLVYFTGRADTPTQSQLYKVGFADGSVTKITQRSGFHKISFSDDVGVYIDNFSTTNTPQQVSLHKSTGEQLTWLSENAVDDNHPLKPYQANWVKPTIASFNLADGTELYYRLYTPHSLKGKHPVIVYQYGGPGVQVVKDSWGGNRGLLMQYWANKSECA